MDAVKLLVILVAIVFALRKKISVGVVLFGAGLLMALLFSLPLRNLLNGYVNLIKSQDFILLTSVVVLITFLGALLKEIGFLEKLSTAVEGLPGGRRTATVLLPPMIGMMPMPGGSLLSAPLVGNVLSHRNYPPDFKVVTNYWFRHIAEFFWPLYAGIILTEAIAGKGIEELTKAIQSNREFLVSSGELEKRRRERAKEELVETIESFVKLYCYREFEEGHYLEDLVNEIAQRKTDPHSAALQIIERIGKYFKQATPD